MIVTAICMIATVLVIMMNHSSIEKSEPNTLKSYLTVSADNNYINCRNFILIDFMSKDGGVYTNYLDEKSDGDITKGHDVLCESQGILMLYAAKSKNKALFDKTWAYVSSKMLKTNGLISWRIEHDVAAEGNATVDDFRIAHALCNAYNCFKDEKYKIAAEKLSSSLLTYCLKKSLPVEGANSDTVLLSYVDLGAIKALVAIDSNWDVVLENSTRLINSSKQSSSLPFYKDQYSTKNERFLQQTEYSLLNSALVVLYQSEIGKVDKNDISWFLKNCESEGLFSKYDIAGNPTSKIESSSIYAITMLIARNTNNEVLYKTAKKRLLNFQVKNKRSPIFGSFGNENLLDVYSFDNLLALLALTPTK